MNKKKPSITKPKPINKQEMQFITSVQIHDSPGMVEHRSSGLAKTTEDIKNDFSLVMNQLNFIVAEADKKASTSQFRLDEITISLGFSATGKLAFIAEAGVEASIEVKFTRK